MADWRFAKKSGLLTWITPDIPDGMELFSELSPTLLTGQQEEGDSLPVEYVKMQHVSHVEQRGTRIILHRNSGASVTLVAATESEAVEWVRTIELTIAEEKPSTVKPNRSGPQAPLAAVAAPPPSLQPQQQQQQQGASQLPPRTTSPAPPLPQPTRTTHTPPAVATAPQIGRTRSMDFADAAAPVEPLQPTTSQQAGASNGSFVPLASLSVAQGIRSRQTSGARTPSTPSNLPLYEPTPRPAAAEQNVSQPLLNRPSHNNSAAPATGSNYCEDGESHNFRPLSDITRGANAQTTTVTTYVDPVRQPAMQFYPKNDSTPVHQQNAGRGAYGPSPAASRPLPARAYQTLGSSLEQPPAGSSISPIPQGRDGTSLPYAGPVGGAATSRYLEPQQRVGGSQPRNQDAASRNADPVDQYDEGVRVARKRSGMMVDVPPNPQLNRNVAPNVSAIWKEWTAPDGILYVSHEPTGTVQRWNAETQEFETLIDGTSDIDAQDMALRPYSGQETAVDISNNVIKNINRYGMNRGPGQDIPNVSSPNVYRTAAVTSPRGQFSPSRRSQLTALVAPRESQSSYHGRRVHHITLSPADEEHSTIEHQIQLLGGGGLRWDPTTGQTVAPQGAQQGDVGASTLHKQWEHVRRILLQGRYFKKHALRTTTSAFRFVFLTSDNAYVVCVPTSEVLFNVNQDPRTFGTVAETIQYYGSESRAIALNTITHVSLGSEEQFVRNRSRSLIPENTFCIVSRTHAFVLECNTSEEAKYFADAWTFFLYHSRPIGTTKSKNPHVKNPVTFGTRGGIAF